MATAAQVKKFINTIAPIAVKVCKNVDMETLKLGLA